MALAAHKTEGAALLLARYPAPNGAAWLSRARNDAAARLADMGAPFGRDEYWRYTPPAALLGDVADVAHVADEALFNAADAHELVFVDGVFDAAQSTILDDTALQIQTLDAADADIHWAADLFGALESAGQNPVPRPMAALNTARAGQGVLIRVMALQTEPAKKRARSRLASKPSPVVASPCLAATQSGHLCSQANVHLRQVKTICLRWLERLGKRTLASTTVPPHRLGVHLQLSPRHHQPSVKERRRRCRH